MSSKKNSADDRPADTTGNNDKKLTVLETHGYDLLKTVGAGAYAKVKVARSARHDNYVAVKIISKFRAPGEHLKKFIPREIQVVKGLKHPNLIKFYQTIETTHRLYIIMEYAHNGSLLDVIKLNVHIDEDQSRKWFRQILDAVDYCHQREVVHRDIKCENILMDRFNNIKLSDFGLAKKCGKPEQGLSPLCYTYCGSYAYVSPEILKGIPYDPKLSDVWSSGVVLYAMVFGTLPYNDENYAHLLKQVQNKLTFPEAPKVSQPCCSLIKKILMPQWSRLNITQIRNDPWILAPQALVQTSAESLVSDKSKKVKAKSPDKQPFQQNSKEKDKKSLEILFNADQAGPSSRRNAK